MTAMASIEFVTIEVADPTAANRFYSAAFGLGTRVRLRASEAPTTGFRGFTLSLGVSQPATVDGLIGATLDAGATSLKPAPDAQATVGADQHERPVAGVDHAGQPRDLGRGQKALSSRSTFGSRTARQGDRAIKSALTAAVMVRPSSW
jgi:hypothetical protein